MIWSIFWVPLNPLNAKGMYIRPLMVISVATNVFSQTSKGIYTCLLVVHIMSTWSLHMLYRDIYIRPWLLLPKQHGILVNISGALPGKLKKKNFLFSFPGRAPLIFRWISEGLFNSSFTEEIFNSKNRKNIPHSFFFFFNFMNPLIINF